MLPRVPLAQYAVNDLISAICESTKSFQNDVTWRISDAMISGNSLRTRVAPRLALKASLASFRLPCADVAQQAAFYSKVMGYAHAPRPGDGSNWRGICNDRPIELVSAGVNVGVGFQVSAEEQVLQRARLVECGVPFTERAAFATRTAHLVVTDPDDNEIAFGDFSVADKDTQDVLSPDLPPARLQHAVFCSLNPDVLIGFYERMGFTITDIVKRDGLVMTAFLRCGRDHHSLAVFRSTRNAIDHHCYETGSWNDIRAWADHFSSKQVSVEWGPGRHGPGNNLFLFVRDTEGNWLEISAELEQVDEGRPVHEWPHEERTLNLWGKGLLRA
jgi:catechol 2,3-dioxygenase